MNNKRTSGFTLIEVSIAVVLIVIVATSAIASLRIGMKTMGGTEIAANAAASIREFREFTYNDSIDDLDLRDDQSYTPVLGDGTQMPNSAGISLNVTVTAVDDYDPTVVVAISESRTRVVEVQATYNGANILEAVWLATEH
ncbi:MAG: prepilin-type N-terminal cleavage/methylation domain-containing protein [Planctomycetes bacterium]|nr:prepilin-type N-terminal cleavage/methylation domain-containing protein [Planctomycetota bacterium]